MNEEVECVVTLGRCLYSYIYKPYFLGRGSAIRNRTEHLT